jgi:hypothetical protein
MTLVVLFLTDLSNRSLSFKTTKAPKVVSLTVIANRITGIALGNNV